MSAQLLTLIDELGNKLEQLRAVVERTTEPPWLPVARGEQGIREITGPEHSERVLQYHHATRLDASTDEVPWCSSFVCWAMEQVGVPSTKSAAARSWLSWGYGLTNYRPGAVVVLSRPPSTSSGHVGFFVASSEGKVHLLGGNQNNSVCVAEYDASRVIGIRWPPGGGA